MAERATKTLDEAGGFGYNMLSAMPRVAVRTPKKWQKNPKQEKDYEENLSTQEKTEEQGTRFP